MIVMFRNIPNIGNCFNLHSATKEKSKDVFFILNKKIKSNNSAELLISHIINLHNIDSKEITEFKIQNIKNCIGQTNFVLHKNLLSIYKNSDRSNVKHKFLPMDLGNGFIDREKKVQLSDKITKILVDEFITIINNVKEEERIYVMQELLKLGNNSITLYRTCPSQNSNKNNYIINKIIIEYTAIIIAAIYEEYQEIYNQKMELNDKIIEKIETNLKTKYINKTGKYINNIDKFKAAFVQYILDGSNEKIVTNISDTKEEAESEIQSYNCCNSDGDKQNEKYIKECYEKIYDMHYNTYSTRNLEQKHIKQKETLEKLQKKLDKKETNVSTTHNKLQHKNQEKDETQKKINNLQNKITATANAMKELTNNTTKTLSNLSNEILKNKPQNNNDILEQKFNNLENQLNNVKKTSQNTTEKKSSSVTKIASTGLTGGLGAGVAMAAHHAVKKVNENSNDPVDGFANDSVYDTPIDYEQS